MSRTDPWATRTRSRQGLDQIRSQLLADAEKSLAAAEQLERIKRECQQKDARIYAQRGLDTIQAVALLDEVIYPPATLGRAQPLATPRRAVTA